MSVTTQHLYFIAYTDLSGFNYRAVQRRCAIKIADDPKQNGFVLYLRIRVECGHHAPLAKLDCANPHLTYCDDAARPVTLPQAFNSCDDYVGAQSPSIYAKP
jgi:hypothetical protein